MPTDQAVPAAPQVRPQRSSGSGDGGFSLVEVLVSLAVIGTVMAGAAPFLIKSITASDGQADQQVAIQLATDALERVRALTPKALLTGRGEPAVKQQWDTAPPAVQRHLGTMRQAADPMLPPDSAEGRDAALPTRPHTVTVNNKTYQQHWYVGRCWQRKLAADQSTVDNCSAPAGSTAVPAGAAFFRTLVAVTWRQRTCPDQACAYVASMLSSVAADPVFDTKRPPPTIKNPGNQLSYLGDVVSLQLTSTGGSLPLTWSVTGLPAGLTMAANGLITGTPTTIGSTSVMVTLTDRKLRADTVQFNWTIRQPPALASPGDQLSWTGKPVSLPLTATGGLAPLKWTSTGLPAGLTINASTGLISGTPTTVQLLTTTVTVTDAGTPGRGVTVSFKWRVLDELKITFPSPQTATIDLPDTATPTGSGGLAPYTWMATDLPLGLTMDPATGTVSGTPPFGTRYIVTVRITDSLGNTTIKDVVYDVNHLVGSDLRITFPNPASPERSTPVGTSVSFTTDASGANRPQQIWSATGLPPGVTITAAGVVSGTPTTRGKYRVTLIVVSEADSGTAKLMFDWSVT
jgi:prepilin-type N-terminal cleavage/methylation domain-containing protein